MTAVADRLAGSAQLRGALIQLPAEADVVAAADAGLDFVVADLIDGPLEEGALSAHVRLAHAAGLLLLALVDDVGGLRRLARLGVDAAVMPTSRAVDPASGIAIVDSAQLTVVHSPDQVSETPFTAVDLAAVRTAALTQFATAEPPAGEPPLVLLAGQLGDVSVWDDVVSALPASGRYIALRIDLDDTIADMAGTVLAAAPPRFALAGHSLGGIVALEICRTAPTRVAKLALLNASGRGPSPAQLAAWAGQLGQLDTGDFTPLVNTLADANLNPALPDAAAHRTRWSQMAATVGAAGLRRQLHAQTTRPDSLPTLSTLTLPTLVLSGDQDAVCRPELQAELVAGLPNAEHVTLPGVGHMAPLEAPAEVAAALTHWLR